MKQIHWGIIGCGKIAEYFAADLALAKNAKLEAVAAREPERARDFADGTLLQNTMAAMQKFVLTRMSMLFIWQRFMRFIGSRALRC